MITVQILFTKKDEAQKALDYLLEERLFYGGYLQMIENWKRQKKLPKYSFNCMLIGLTRSVVYNKVLTFLENKFSGTDYIAYTSPVLNISGKHEDLLKKEVD